ncbi:hypothetical protein PHLCEN_2v5143 [Hermanssonia centrifuga]|uniref:Uncharacterized protein n=1 Tax=Hermanssonia centrifuga TaxID=98765 RepID=A0A2R6PBS0_9APHY|nr:hypothetical protein PHLCEN_2v5143 [Hermanssonia centrifuga]
MSGKSNDQYSAFRVSRPPYRRAKAGCPDMFNHIRISQYFALLPDLKRFYTLCPPFAAGCVVIYGATELPHRLTAFYFWSIASPPYLNQRRRLPTLSKMNTFLTSVLCAFLLSHATIAAPAASSSAASSSMIPAGSGTSIASAASATPTVPYASNNPNGIMWNPDSDSGEPQPIRGGLGATILGPQNVAIDIQNPDILAPPTTDAGTV